MARDVFLVIPCFSPKKRSARELAIFFGGVYCFTYVKHENLRDNNSVFSFLRWRRGGVTFLFCVTKPGRCWISFNVKYIWECRCGLFSLPPDYPIKLLFSTDRICNMKMEFAVRVEVEEGKWARAALWTFSHYQSSEEVRMYGITLYREDIQVKFDYCVFKYSLRRGIIFFRLCFSVWWESVIVKTGVSCGDTSWTQMPCGMRRVAALISPRIAISKAIGWILAEGCCMRICYRHKD